MLRITYRIDPPPVTLIIKDQGPGFDPSNLPHAASDEDPIGHIEIRNEMGRREGGFGIMLARGLVDQFRYNRRVTKLLWSNTSSRRSRRADVGPSNSGTYVAACRLSRLRDSR